MECRGIPSEFNRKDLEVKYCYYYYYIDDEEIARISGFCRAPQKSTSRAWVDPEM